MTHVWRLLIDAGPAEGTWNMALDRAIQLSCDAGDSPPTLRLYSWVRPTATLGRFQDLAGVDLDVCASEGIDVVRRFTGGRGVLHDDELTYSIVAGVSDGIPRGTAASYKVLCGALAEAYAALGVGASLNSRTRGASGTSACYLSTAQADLSLDERKLSGSAQVWFRDTVLQHGSFVVSRDAEREARVFRLGDADATLLASHTVTLADALSVVPGRSEMADAVARGVARAFGVALEMGEVSQAEVARAEEILPQTDPRTPRACRRVTGST